MRIFLISGKARSGKNEVANIIKFYYDQKGEKTVVTEYSKYVKVFAKEMTDWDGTSSNKPRIFLQEMGDFIRKNLKMPLLFIERMKTDMKVYEKFYDNVIISDVRYPNEIEEIKHTYRSVYSMYIVNEHGNDNLSVKEKNHDSEHALDDYNEFDYILVNQERKELQGKILKILKEINEGVEKYEY